MNKNETLTLWLALGAALFAVFLVYGYTQDKTTEITKTLGAQQQVVVAKKSIRELETLQEDLLELQPMPAKYLQPGYASSVEEVLGLVALAPIRKGEQILKNKVIKPGIETGLSLQVTPGKRAITLPNSKGQGVTNLLKPGDRIDILTALDVNRGGASSQKFIKVLLQDVVILATGEDIVHEVPLVYEDVGNGDLRVNNLRRKSNFDTITVEVSPTDAQNLVYVLATNKESMFFTLRHPSDNVRYAHRTVSISDLVKKADTKARTPAVSR